MKSPMLMTVIPTFLALSLSYTTDAQMPEFDTEAIDAAVTAYMTENEVPGVVLGIVVGDAIVYTQCYGVADASSEAPMKLNTTFQIASVTKLFTASLMVALEQDGILSAGDPVDTFLVDATAPRDARGRVIRLMDLATHTSGLPKEPPNRKDRPDSPTVMEPYSQADLYEALANTELLYPTGGEVEYSNFGYGLLGHALERAAGAPLEEVMRARLWEPLGMKHTYVFDRPDGASDLAASHWDWYSPRHPSPVQEFGDIWGMIGIHTTLADLARFASLQFRAHDPEASVIDGHRLAEMHRPRVLMSSSFGDENGAFGIGWIVKSVPGAGMLIEHEGSNDGHSAYLGVQPEKGVGLIVLANLGGVADEIGEAVLPQVLAPAIAFNNELREAIGSGAWETAIPVTTKLLAWNPCNWRAHYWLGRALTETGQYEEAVPHLDAAYAAGLYRNYIAFYQAVCAAEAGQFDKAGEALQRALKLGFVDGERLQQHPVLNALADHPAYRMLKRYADH